MSKEQLKHIFEHTACLTPRQMKGYISGKMVHEEAHAVEVHLLSCPFCREAIEGLEEQKGNGSLTAIEKPDTAFIAKHFGVSSKELNLGNTTGAVPPKAGRFTTYVDKEQKTGGGNVRKLLKPIGIAASLVAVAAIMWFMRDTIFPAQDKKQLAQQQPAAPAEPEEREIVYQPVDTTIADEAIATDTSVTREEIKEPAEEALAIAAMDAEKDEKPNVEEKAKQYKKEKEKELLAAAKKEADRKKAEQKKVAEKLAVNESKKETEKIPDVSSAALPPRPRMGNSYSDESAGANTYEQKEEPKKEEVAVVAPPKKKIELGTARSGILKGDEFFNEGKYKKALRQYQKVMYDPQSNQKDAATLMAAKCHVAEEEMMQARTLLNSLIKENSTKKDEAAGLLKQLPKEE